MKKVFVCYKVKRKLLSKDEDKWSTTTWPIGVWRTQDQAETVIKDAFIAAIDIRDIDVMHMEVRPYTHGLKVSSGYGVEDIVEYIFFYEEKYINLNK